MDSSSSSPHHDHQNWLAFSLSNHPHLHLSLFEAFSSPNPDSVHLDSSTTTTATEHPHPHHGATDLAMFTGGEAPKLEDFLGGGAAAPPPPPMAQFSAETTAVSFSSNTTTTAEIYESELKTIAASFLRGYNNNNNNNHNNNNTEIIEAQQPPAMAMAMAVAAPAEPASNKKTVDTFGQRTSIYRGVTRHRWTGRYEAHLWDNSCRREGQSRKGRQVYLGGYDKEEKAARAYDLAALKYWGPTTTTNFPVSNYEKELEEMKNMTRQEFVASLRRKSSGFSRGASIYRGVTRHHQHGRWQARIGRVAGNKDLYLGTFSTQEEAAEAYDIAAIKFRGLNAVTNFDMSRYDVKSIVNSNLPIGGMSHTTKSKNSSDQSEGGTAAAAAATTTTDDLSSASSATLNFALPIKQDPSENYWSNIFAFQNPSTTTIAKNPSSSTLFHGNPNSALPFNMDFSASTTTTTTTTTTGSTSHDHQNNGGFFAYSHHHQQQQQQQHEQQNGTNTVAFAMPISVNSTYETSSTGYNNNNWTSIGQAHLHTFHHHHQAHAKPNTLFQTPIFGME